MPPKKRKSTKKKSWGWSKSKSKNFVIKIPSDLKYLLIHESPTEAITVKWFMDKISKFLWGTTMALATAGHFYKTDSSSVDIDEDKWEMWYSLDRAKSSIVNNLKKAIEQVRKNKWKVYLLTDPDREGEVIAYFIHKHFKLKKWEFKRVYLNSLWEKDYLNWLKNSYDDLDWNLVEGGLVRAMLDKYIWYVYSPVLWNRLKGNKYKIPLEHFKEELAKNIEKFKEQNAEVLKHNDKMKSIIKKYEELDFSDLDTFEGRSKISLWRVQTPLLRLLVEKDLEKFYKDLDRKVNLFMLDKEENSWEYENNKTKEIDVKFMNIIYQVLKYALENNNIKEVKVIDIKENINTRKPPTPMNTQIAQTSINSFLWYPVKKIMEILQNLYAKQYTSYMRTDGINITPSYLELLKESLAKSWVKAKMVLRDYVEQGHKEMNQDEDKENHHAILPTKTYDISKFSFSNLSPQENKVLEYVVKRTLASILEEAKIKTITYKLQITFTHNWVEKKANFLLKDSEIVKKGFLEVFDYSLNDYVRKFNFKVWDKIKVKDFILKEKDIRLPWWYTEGKVIEELERLWIGRPSTWDNIIDTLRGKWYIGGSSKIEVLPKWYWVYQAIKENDDVFWDIFDLWFTANMEEDLDLLAKWKKKKKEIMEKLKDKIKKENLD